MSLESLCYFGSGSLNAHVTYDRYSIRGDDAQILLLLRDATLYVCTAASSIV